jgi:hypothetical protein
MKTIISAAFFLLLVLFMSCKEKIIGPASNDGVAPQPVTIANTPDSILSIPGGSTITYYIPDDKDLLYVKAVYTLQDGVTYEVKSSAFVNNLTLTGFGDTLKHEVQLYAVDKGGNESEPVTVSVKPLPPTIWSIAKTLKIGADWSTVNIAWDNPTLAPIGVIIHSPDTLGRDKQWTFYSSAANGLYAWSPPFHAGRFPMTVEVKDRWSNYTQPLLIDTMLVLYDQPCDKSKFQRVGLPGDITFDSSWGKNAYMWDNIYPSGNLANFGHTTNPATSGLMPWVFTIDLGDTVKLSRGGLWSRMDKSSYYYAMGNPSAWEIWGWTGSGVPTSVKDDWTGWVKIASAVAGRPSGGAYGAPVTPEDKQHLFDGDIFKFDPAAPKVRIIRLKILSLWAPGTPYCHISELSFWKQQTN